MRVIIAVFFLLLTSVVLGQESGTLSRTKKVAISERIIVDTVSINSSRFRVLDARGKVIDTTKYQIDFAKSELFISETLRGEQDSITIEYLR